MTSQVDYHDAHDAYIDAVAEALRAAGFRTVLWWGDANDPRDGWIEVSPIGAYRSQTQVGLGWQEERGWHVLTVKEDAGWNKRGGHSEDARCVYPLAVATVASPETVVTTFAEMAGVKAEVPGDAYPDLDFPEHSFEDEDPAFEAALAAYRSGS